MLLNIAAMRALHAQRNRYVYQTPHISLCLKHNRLHASQNALHETWPRNELYFQSLRECMGFFLFTTFGDRLTLLPAGFAFACTFPINVRSILNVFIYRITHFVICWNCLNLMSFRCDGRINDTQSTRLEMHSHDRDRKMFLFLAKHTIRKYSHTEQNKALNTMNDTNFYVW